MNLAEQEAKKFAEQTERIKKRHNGEIPRLKGSRNIIFMFADNQKKCVCITVNLEDKSDYETTMRRAMCALSRCYLENNGHKEFSEKDLSEKIEGEIKEREAKNAV